MLTRSKMPKYEVDINFDDASLAWKSNKKRLTNGTYVYICDHIFKNGNRCIKQRSNNSILCERHTQK